MKIKYAKRLKKMMLLFLSFFIAIGSFVGLFAVQASAYETVGSGQLKLRSGICYNGRDPSDPFIYITEYLAINNNTYAPAYRRGNDGAGGNIGGTSDILLKRINTGEAWSSVPLYRVSRSGGYSDDLPYVTGDATDIVTGGSIQSAINSLNSINRQVSLNEANMIQQVLVNGFKAGTETTGSGNSYSWDDNLRYLATQILIWEIQEGKRWSFGTADGNYRQEADTVGSNPWYWKQYWDNEVMPRAYPGITNWYYWILEACQATTDKVNIFSDNTGASADASTRKSNAGTLNASYQGDGRYQLAFHLSNGSLWGDRIGQFNAAGVEWIPDSGSRGAQLSWNGCTGYLTSGWERPDEPVIGYLKFTQNASATAFNKVGYMSGSTSNSWRGFLFGGNSASTELYIRVGSTGGPQPITVRFVDENGSEINCDWTFQTNGFGDQFTEKTSGKTFLPQYYLDNHKEANYTIRLNSVPTQYEMPSLNETMFHYYSGGVLKLGAGGTGWGSWDYGACRASFNGNTITITLKSKPQLPVTVKFVDNDTGQPVAVNFKSLQKTGLIAYTEAFSVTNKSTYTWTPTAKKQQQLQVTVPLGYDYCPTVLFSYQYGYPMNVSGGTAKLLDNGVIEVRLFKITAENSITIEIRDGRTEELIPSGHLLWSARGGGGDTQNFSTSSQIVRPRELGVYTVSGIYYDATDINNPVNVQIPESKFEYNGQSVRVADENESMNIVASDRLVTVYVFLDGTSSRKSLNLSFKDGITGDPVEVDWALFTNNWDLDTQDIGSAASFVPQYYRDTKESMYYYLSLLTVPNEYVSPSRSETFFLYDETGQLVNTNTPEENSLSGAVFDEASNTIVIQLFKVDDRPLTVQFIDGDTGAPVEAQWKLVSPESGYTEVDGWYAQHSFVPQTFLDTRRAAHYDLNITALPEGYGYPASTGFEFVYTEIAALYKSMSDIEYAASNATLDEATNTITIRLSKTIVPDMDISFLPPNSDYHFGEEVISSYYLKNNSSTAYNPTTFTLTAQLTLEKKNGGQLTTQNITGIVCPGNATQLVYFKWTVPEGVAGEVYQLRTIIFDPKGNLVTETTDGVTVADPVQMETPPNKFDLDGGKNFTPAAPLSKNQDYHNSGSWQQYVWENGQFTVKTYSAKLWNAEISVYPDETNPSAMIKNNKEVITKSGYGMKLRLIPKIEQYEGTAAMQNESQITTTQFARAYYPEYKYGVGATQFSTLNLTAASQFAFRQYQQSTYRPGEQGDARKHFIPMWYPDGKYVVQCQTSGCWTPAGMLSYTDEANPVTVQGSLYDDWYSSGNGN